MPIENDNEKVAVAEMQRIYSLLDHALAEWASKQTFVKQMLLTLIYKEQILAPEDRPNDMWKPENIQKIGVFYWDPEFPRALYDQMVEGYLTYFAVKFRADMIPPAP